jgi:hypothetical protein
MRRKFRLFLRVAVGSVAWIRNIGARLGMQALGGFSGASGLRQQWG